MIVGVGTDIVEVKRVLTACQNERFLQKYYTEKERALIEKRNGSAATNFAAKEAVSKVLGTGFSGFAPRDIEVLRDPAGKPCVILYNGARLEAERLGITHIQLSLSDCKEYAVAFAVGEGDHA